MLKALEKTLNKTTQQINELCSCTFIIHYVIPLPSMTLKRSRRVFLHFVDHMGKFPYVKIVMTQVIIRFIVKYRNFKICGLLSVWIKCNIPLANFPKDDLVK